MSSLEALIASAGEGPLQDSLSYTLPQASSAIIDRKTICRAYPTSASTVGPSGTKTVRIRLGGDGFVDSSSVRLCYQLTNTDATMVNGVLTPNPLSPAVGPHGVWSQVRELSNGVEVTSLPNFNRMYQLHGLNLGSLENQYQEAAFGWGGGWNGTSRPTQGVIIGNTSVQVSHKLTTTLLSSGRILPIRWMPCELELTAAPASDWLNTTVILAGGTNAVPCSTSYTISNIMLTYDSVQLDEAVNESFYSALLNSRRLNLPCVQAFQISQSIPTGATTFTMSIVRAFSRLSHMYITFRAAGKVANEFICPTAQNGALFNNLTNPQFSQDVQAPTCRVSLGPKSWPEQSPLGTYGMYEYYSQLQKSLPNAAWVDRKDFMTDAFAMSFSFLRTPGDITSAVSTRSGDSIRIDLRGLSASLNLTEIHCTLFCYAVVSVAEQGICLLD